MQQTKIEKLSLHKALHDNRFLELMSMKRADLLEMDDYEKSEFSKELKSWLRLINRKDLPFTELFISSAKGKLSALNGMLEQLIR